MIHIHSMYPFWSAILSAAIAQLLKPFCYYITTKEWHWSYMKASGGFPSSHSAMVSALALAVGLTEGFNSTLFAVTLSFAVIVIYDAANVRYYSGQNIKVTKQLVKDVQTELHTTFKSPLYNIKMKDILGHKWREVVGGICLGALIAWWFYHL